MRTAITGVTGYLGGHVGAALAKRGVAARPLVRSPRGLPGEVVGDLSGDPSELYARLGSPELLVHFAWEGLPDYNGAHHVDRELPRQIAFLKGMMAAGVRRIAVAGTCFEYGMQYGPLNESLATKPVTAYGRAKDLLRQRLVAAAAVAGVELCWARVFYLWGPGQSASSLYSLVQAAIAAGAKEFDMSGGEQLRDFLAVARAADMFASLAISDGEPGIVNLCSGEPISVRRLVESWIADAGAELKLNLGRYSYLAYEPMAFWGDATRCNAILEAA